MAQGAILTNHGPHRTVRAFDLRTSGPPPNLPKHRQSGGKCKREKKSHEIRGKAASCWSQTRTASPPGDRPHHISECLRYRTCAAAREACSKCALCNPGTRCGDSLG